MRTSVTFSGTGKEIRNKMCSRLVTEEGKKEQGGQTATEEMLLLTEQEGTLNVEAV